MRRALVSFLLTLPLFAQLPAGTSRVPFRDDITDAMHLAATGDVLWVASFLDDRIERVETGGARMGLNIPPSWQYTTAVAAGPDGAFWLGSAGWIARVDPATEEFQRWPLGMVNGPRALLSGPDGNLWLVQDGAVLRMRPDGAILSSHQTGGDPTGAAFGSDGALYLSMPGKLVRMTAAGERTEFAASPRWVLFAGPSFLWTADPHSGSEAAQTPVHEIVKMSYRGEILATYPIDMMPLAADPLGNLWLRARTPAGDVIGQLTASGVLTRFGPLPSPVSTECHPRSLGGLTFLADGRVAMSDYYLLVVNTLLSPCRRVVRPEAAKNTITILDPRLAPVLSIETLERSSRRRSARH
ncbi:MAG TPA: hypothetical protein VF883_17700 [Thermoanaerobaculia bacterium]|jgi:hypothetical protein